MKSPWPLRLAVAAAVLALLAAWRGWAAAFTDLAKSLDPARSEGASAIALIGGASVLLFLGVLGKMVELRARRLGEAVAVQGVIADALVRDPALLGFPLTPTARVPLWRGAPVTIRIVGQVPTDQLRHAAIRLVKKRARSDLVVTARIRSRIRVVPTATRSNAVRTGRSGLPASPWCAGA